MRTFKLLTGSKRYSLIGNKRRSTFHRDNYLVMIWLHSVPLSLTLSLIVINKRLLLQLPPLSRRTVRHVVPNYTIFQLLWIRSSHCKLPTKTQMYIEIAQVNTIERNTTVQYSPCKDLYEAWRHECPAWIVES